MAILTSQRSISLKWQLHLLSVLQSVDLIVLLLDLQLQPLPLVGEGQPLLPEFNFFDNQVLEGIQGFICKS